VPWIRIPRRIRCAAVPRIDRRIRITITGELLRLP